MRRSTLVVAVSALVVPASLPSSGGQGREADPAIVTCADLRKIDWSHEASWQGAIKFQKGREISDDDTHKLVAKVEAMLQPVRLSAELKNDLADTGASFFFYFHPPGSKVYYFGNTQGSGNCNYDTWAESLGDSLTEIEKPPFAGQSLCDAPVYFGVVKKDINIVVQFQYRRPTPLDQSPPIKVNVGVADPRKWGRYCSFDLAKK